MDERLLLIVKAMARGELSSERYSTTPYSCLYCGQQTWYHPEEIESVTLAHKDNCPVTLARQYLKENDTPANLYKVSRKHKGQTYVMYYEVACTAKEALLLHPRTKSNTFKN